MTAPRQTLRRAARFAPEVALAALVLVGVFRPQLPTFLRADWVASVAFLGVTAAALKLLRLCCSRPADPYLAALRAVFPLVLMMLYLQPQRVASDGVYYFATLRSLVVDGDLDFQNEYRILGASEGHFQPTATGRLPNTFSVGPALVWAPAYLLVHGLGYLGLFRPTGFGYPYFTAVSTVTAMGGLLGVLWLYRLVRRYSEPPAAFLSALLIWWGTFHIWYMVFEPSMSHALGMASVSGFLLLSHHSARSRWDFALLGLAAGMVILIRWQNAVFLPAGLGILWAGEARPKWSGLSLAALTALAVFLPQIVFWRLIYGEYFLVPQGGGYLLWSAPGLEAVLFSSRHGLLSWSPVLWLGLAGLFFLLRKTPLAAASLLSALAVTTYINAAVFDWWAGASFGARRFDGALAAFGIGLGAAIERLVPWVRKHGLLVVSLALAPFLLWNMGLMELYSRGTMALDGAVSFRQAANDSLELAYRRTGYPFSWPGALAWRYRSGLPLSTYDLAGARYLSHNVDVRMGDTDALHLGRGWSLPQREREHTVREIDRQGASVYVALREPASYELEITGRSEGPLSLIFQERRVGSVDLGEKGGAAKISLPRESVVAGLNELVLLPAPGRRAFVSRLSFIRAGEP